MPIVNTPLIGSSTTAVLPAATTEWPRVAYDDYCGEFKLKDPTAP